MNFRNPMTTRSLTLALSTAALFGACASEPASDDTPELMQLYEDRDFFSLEERLDERPDLEPRFAAFFQAATEHAFNEPAASNATLEAVLQDETLPADLALKAWEIRLANDLRLGHYAEALEATEAARALPAAEADAETRDDLENMIRVLRPLVDVPPMQATVRGETLLQLDEGRALIRIQGVERRFAIDTGANVSVLMRSEAKALGLEILEAQIVVGTSTDLEVHADLAVADEVSLGNIDYRHVVFLVFPDELLTIPDGPTIRGLIGFPLIEAAGEIRFRRGGIVEIPARPSATGQRNLALVQFEPLVRLQYAGEFIVCRFDTGANATDFYEPFYERFRNVVEEAGTFLESQTAGVGGMRTIPGYRMPTMTLALGGVDVTLEEVDVYTRPIVDEKDNFLLCNAGLDLLAPFESYALNFRSMSVVVRE